MLLTHSSLVSVTASAKWVPPDPVEPTVTAESGLFFITGAEAAAVTAGVAIQVLGAAIDTTLAQVSGAFNPSTITPKDFEPGSTTLRSSSISGLSSISALKDSPITGGQDSKIPTLDFTRPTRIGFPVIPPP
jgi:hypothetical protein